MNYAYTYEVNFPEFCDEGPDDITVTPDDPVALALFIHPSALNVTDREYLELLYKTYMRAAVTIQKKLAKQYPETPEIKFSDIHEPLKAYIYESIGEGDVDPCVICGKKFNGLCTEAMQDECEELEEYLNYS